MGNSFFRFKKFTINQGQSAMKVTTDACLFGAWAASEISCITQVKHILDIGAGTGLLSLMVAQKTEATIDAIELDPGAAKQSEENIIASQWKDRINIMEGDVKKVKLPKLDEYDIIISNPPFYENELGSSDINKNIAHHGEGLLLREVFDLIKLNLSENGRFFLLLPYKRFSDTKELVTKNKLSILKIIRVRQTPKHNCFRFFISGNKKMNDKSYESDEITIRNGKNEYTPEFISLLKDYYLYI